MTQFAPRVALASLSGRSDAGWARQGAEWAGVAFLGGIAVDGPTRTAAREMVDRDREEFLPEDPVAFVDRQFRDLSSASIRPGINVRASEARSLRPMAKLCRRHGAILEVNAHCRQAEMCRAGAGEALLRDPERLVAYVREAAGTGATTSVKVRTELSGVDLPAVAARAGRAGADLIHVDAMDSEGVVADVVEAVPGDIWVVANNEVRGPDSTREYLAYGADAVSVGRASDDPGVMKAVSETVGRWFGDWEV